MEGVSGSIDILVVLPRTARWNIRIRSNVFFSGALIDIYMAELGIMTRRGLRRHMGRAVVLSGVNGRFSLTAELILERKACSPVFE